MKLFWGRRDAGNLITHLVPSPFILSTVWWHAEMCTAAFSFWRNHFKEKDQIEFEDVKQVHCDSDLSSNLKQLKQNQLQLSWWVGAPDQQQHLNITVRAYACWLDSQNPQPHNISGSASKPPCRLYSSQLTVARSHWLQGGGVMRSWWRPHCVKETSELLSLSPQELKENSSLFSGCTRAHTHTWMLMLMFSFFHFKYKSVLIANTNMYSSC